MSRAAKRWVIACGLLGFASLAHAELLGAKAESIASHVLGQNRAIEVYLPEEAPRQPSQRFETLYVLDGDWNARIVIQTVNFMRQLGMIPPIIVVSVPNYFDAHGTNSRDRDLTPSAVADEPRSGGAADFLTFLKSELIPFVDQHYPANGTHLVHGHSYGGLFLMYVLENEPQLFDGYLVLDPAMWWDHDAFKAGLRARLATLPGHGKAVYIAGRTGLGAKDMGLDDLEPILQAGFPKSLHWQMRLYEDETHDSLKLKATYDALKYVYGGYTQDPPEVAPEQGIMLRNQAVRMAVFGQRLDVHYTTDGSEPSDSSPALNGGALTVSDPDKTRIRLLSTRGLFDREIPIHLKFGAPLPPTRTPGAREHEASWRYALYAPEAWARLAGKRAGPALRTGTATDQLLLKDAGRERVAGRLDRMLEIPADGYFVFAVHASQSRLRLGATTLITNDGPDERRMRSFIVPLRRGSYPLSVDFVTATENPSLYVAVFRCEDDKPAWWTQRPWLELRTH